MCMCMYMYAGAWKTHKHVTHTHVCVLEEQQMRLADDLLLTATSADGHRALSQLLPPHPQHPTLTRNPPPRKSHMPTHHVGNLAVHPIVNHPAPLNRHRVHLKSKKAIIPRNLPHLACCPAPHRSACIPVPAYPYRQHLRCVPSGCLRMRACACVCAC